MRRARQLGVHLLLVHELPRSELPGPLDERTPAAAPFESVVAGAPEQFGDSLGLFSSIALPLKPAPYRRSSMLLLTQAIIDYAPAVRRPRSRLISPQSHPNLA